MPREYMYHRIQRLVGMLISPPSDFFDEVNDRGNNIAPLDHCTYAHITASEALRNGTKDVIPDHLSYRSYVLGRQRVLVHERVHGRIDVCRRRGRQRAQQRCLFQSNFF